MNGAQLVAVARWSSRAREHLRRRGFSADEADDAVQGALLDLAERLDRPAFAPPRDPKAYLFACSVGKAYQTKRAGKRFALAGATFNGIAGTTVQVVALTEIADDDASTSPSRQLDSEAEQHAFIEWHGRA